MKAKIVNLKSQTTLGLVYKGANTNGEIPAMWQVFNARFSELKPKNNTCYGLCYMDPLDQSFAYMACAAVDTIEDIPDGMETMVIPEGKYAVFTFSDHISQIKPFWDQIYQTYLPENQLIPLNQMSFELYDERFMQNGSCDIYIPVA